jgi:hypothetical protein
MSSFGFGEEADLLGETALGLGLGERADQRRRRDEENRVAGVDDGAAEADREVSLADARRAEEHRRKMRNLDAHRDALLLLSVELVAEDLVEEVEVGGLLSGRLRQDRIEPLRHRAEAQSREPLLDTSTNDPGRARQGP